MNKATLDNLNGHRGQREASRIFHDGERAMLRKRMVKRLRHLNVEKLIGSVLERGKKWLQLLRTTHPTKEKLPVFVVGCNRSGTNMVCAAMGRSPHGLAFQESVSSLAFKGYYLRSDWIINLLLRSTPAPIVSFGSILDSQFTDDLLTRFEGAKALWVYRRYGDVANSCARMQWGHHLKDYARWLARGELEKLGARGERISTDTIRLFADLYHEDLSNEESACLYWYMRNRLYFDLNLHKDPRALIVQYEDTVQNKERALRRIFDFLGLPYDSTVVDGIFSSSVGKHPWPDVDPAIEEACEALQTQLDLQYAKTSQWTMESKEATVPGTVTHVR